MINERAPLEMKYLDMNHIRDPSDLFSMGSKIVAIILFLVSQSVRLYHKNFNYTVARRYEFYSVSC